MLMDYYDPPPPPTIKGWAVRVNNELLLKFYNARSGAVDAARVFLNDPATRAVEIVPMMAHPATE